MKFPHGVAIAVVVVVLSACLHAAPREDIDALLVTPSAACRSDLTAAAGALAGAPTLLADDAFTRSSTVAVERRRVRDPSSGRELGGLDSGVPRLLRLVLRDASSCDLVGQGRETRRDLPACLCRAANALSQ